MAEILIFGDAPRNLVLPPQGVAEVIITKNPIEVKRRVCVEDFTMIIIDLDGREEHAMELARYIRDIPCQIMTPILFLARGHNQELDAFHDIHCYDYLIKPLSLQDVMKILFLCIQRMESADPEREIVFCVRAKQYPVNINDIMYIECLQRVVTVHTTTIDLRVPSLCLTSFIRDYAEDFLQIHRSVIVNRRFIRYIDPVKSVIELKGTRENLSIGKTYLSSVRNAFEGS